MLGGRKEDVVDREKWGVREGQGWQQEEEEEWVEGQWR